MRGVLDGRMYNVAVIDLRVEQLSISILTSGLSAPKPFGGHKCLSRSTLAALAGSESVLRLFLVFVGIELPALGFVKLVYLSLHVLDYLVLQGGQLSLPVEHALVGCQEHVEADQLPFGQAFRLLDICERIAREVPSAVRIDLAEFAIFALNHVLPSIWIAGHNARGIYGTPGPLTSALRSDFLFFCFTTGLWYHTVCDPESYLR